MSQHESHCAVAYARALLADRGVAAELPAWTEEHPARRWAQSGAMVLTGEPQGPPQMCPVPLASYADGVLAALRALAPADARLKPDGAGLLAERAALAGLRRAGAISPGGACRLLRTADGYVALTLARPSDWALLPAWLERGALDSWEAVGAELHGRALPECVARGRELGLALAPLASGSEPRAAWCRELRGPPGASPALRRLSRPRVIDLSSLWAGPLCTHLLQQLGAEVIKVESTQRPDGLRAAPGDFFALLNAGKASVALDFRLPQAREQLQALLRTADIVVEASRPRALRQLGIEAAQLMDENPALTWVSITGYGREEPQANWVAFGDDAGVAGGLSQVLRCCTGRPVFCADAVADPLTGMHAALAAWASHVQGGGRFLSVALSEVVAHCVRCAAAEDSRPWAERARAWAELAGVPLAPRARACLAPAAPLGADTARILRSTLRPRQAPL